MLQRFRLSLLGGTTLYSLFAVALLAMLSRTAPVHAATIVNDTWIDGIDDDPASPVHSEFGVDSDSDGDLESAWYQGGDGTLNPVGVNGPERGKFSVPTSASSASWTTYFTPEGTPITLANAGDFLKVTWVFTPTNINNGGSNTSQNFRFAIVDSPAAQRLTANGAPGSGAYTGYAMFANMSGTLGNSSPFRLEKRNVASGDPLATSGNWTAVGTTGATSGNHGYDSGTQYTLTWLITRNASAGLDHNVSLTGGTLDGDGTAQVLFTDAAPGALGGFVFDTFALRPSGATTTAEQFDTSLFKVETNTVPEPASLVLIAFGGLTIGFRSRRQRTC
jgi:PEP-CTERM motif-containing protein